MANHCAAQISKEVNRENANRERSTPSSEPGKSNCTECASRRDNYHQRNGEGTHASECDPSFGVEAPQGIERTTGKNQHERCEQRHRRAKREESNEKRHAEWTAPNLFYFTTSTVPSTGYHSLSFDANP